MTDIIQLEKERMEWALVTFPEATANSSLRKLRGEIEEVELELMKPDDVPQWNPAEEYADCLMCLFDSAGRAGISPEVIFKAFEHKLKKNKARKWAKNPDNTYSHVKP